MTTGIPQFVDSTPRHRSRRSAGALALAALPIVACLGAGCGHRERAAAPTHHRNADGNISISGSSRDYLQVEAAAEPPPTASRSLFARVAFNERKVVALGAPVSGRIAQVFVTTGAVVTKGQPLLMIHSADVAAANAQHTEARHTRMLAEQAASRTAMLVKQGAGSIAERQQADTALKNAREEEHRMEQSLRALGVGGTGANYILRAAISGTVVERSVNVGNAVAADQGAPLITVADLSNVWVLVDVYEQDLPYVKAGNAARVEFPNLRGRIYEGKVAYVGDVVEAESRAARARIELDNADRALRPGMFAEVEIRAPELATAWIPTSAVLARRDEFYVFVALPGEQFTAHKVLLGQQRGDHVAILSGLKPGEMVVTRGAILLDAEANSVF